MPEDRITVVQMRTSTRERLKKRGSKGEAYDGIIIRLLDATETTGAAIHPAP